MAQQVKRKMPVKTRHIELDGDFEGWNFTARVNYSVGVLTDLASGNADRMVAAMVGVILDWNFVDEDGKPIPSPKELRDRDKIEQVIRTIPLDLFQAMSEAAQKAPAEVDPNS